jgi:cellulose biosynthesis protein BcsQ
MRLTVCGLKGGLGKSTAAVMFARTLQLSGRSVTCVDADPKSQSIYDWNKLAGGALPFAVEVWPSVRVGELVAERVTTQDTVIDTGGDTEEILASAVAVSTHVVMVTTPRKADVRRLAATYKAVRNAADDAGVSPRVFLLLTMCDTRRAAYNAQIAQQLSDAGLPLLGMRVPTLSAYADAYGTVPRDGGLYADVLGEMARRLAA